MALYIFRYSDLLVYNFYKALKGAIMNKSTYKSDKLKKCLAVIISVVLIVSLSFSPGMLSSKTAFADDTTGDVDQTAIDKFLDPKVPDTFTNQWDNPNVEEEIDPYGYGYNYPFIMNEQDELFWASSDHE